MGEEIHMEVLLPAFVVGCVIDTPCARQELEIQKSLSLERRLSRQLKRNNSSFSSNEAQVHVKRTSKNSLSSHTSAAHRTLPALQVCKRDDESQANPHLQGTGDLAKSPPITIPHDQPAVIQDVEGGNAAPTICKRIPEDNLDQCRIQSATRCPAPTRQVSNPSVEPLRKGSKVAWTDNEPIVKSLEVPEQEEQRRPSKQSNVSSVSVASCPSLTRYGLPRQTPNQVATPPLQVEPGELPLTAQSEVESVWEERVLTIISMVFMVLVGLSMPALFGDNAADDAGGSHSSTSCSDSASISSETNGGTGISADAVVGHVLVVSILMVLGKMFPIFCYRDETGLKNRLALCLGMCPRGEVGASIIVIALELNVDGPALIVSMIALAANLVLTGGFIGAVKILVRSAAKDAGEVVAFQSNACSDNNSSIRMTADEKKTAMAAVAVW